MNDLYPLSVNKLLLAVCARNALTMLSLEILIVEPRRLMARGRTLWVATTPENMIGTWVVATHGFLTIIASCGKPLCACGCVMNPRLIACISNPAACSSFTMNAWE